MPFSNYLESKLLNEVLGDTAYSVPGTLYLGLSTAAVGSSDAAILAGEPSSTGGYARVAITNNTTNFPNATGSAPATKELATSEAFPASSAPWSSGSTPLQTFFLADASTLDGGNLLVVGALSVGQAVNAAGITCTFASDTLTVTLV